MSSLLSAELAATCNALGNFDAKSNKYYADANTLETVKDLIRYLRRDDENHDIRRQLGRTKVIQTDLIPLLRNYWEEADLFDVLLRVIVNLTTPALILWNEEIPTDKIVRNYYLESVDHLQSYKEAFTDEAVWAVLSTKLSRILEIEYSERGEENSLIIERILILIRNVLYVPAHTLEKRPDNDASIHDQVLWALHRSGMLDIILYITSSANEQAYYMHTLEIMSYMLREQKASELARADLQRSQTEKIRDEAEMLALLNKEKNEKQNKMKKYAGTRHSRFGGTFVVQSMKSISDNNHLIYHKPLNRVDSLSFDAGKPKPKTPKNRLPFVSNTGERRSAFTIRLFLKEFCVEFLRGSYNKLMYQAKNNLVRAKAQSHDESYYLWAIAFFMEFNRNYKFDVKLVSETMSVQTFHYVQQQSETHFDMMQTDKKKVRLWSRRLHIALLAYRELFHTLSAMDRSPDGTVRDSSRVIKSNIFYVPEYREFILTLLVTYDELKMSDVYLRDLLETQHIFLKMFETFCGGKEGSVLVQKKVKGKRHKKKKAALPPQPRKINLESKWDEISSQLSAILQDGGDFTTDVVPFDAASEVAIDDQKAEAMVKIQRKLRNSEFESALALLRAAREVWPENDSFGSNNMPPEEEFLALREIFFADLGENTEQISHQPAVEANEDDQNDDDEDEDEDEPRYLETDLSFDDFIKRLPHPKIVRACSLALANFQTNPISTNHCVVKLLHRIAFDCKMYVMLFQLSIFRTFQKIFATKDSPQYKELVKFATYIMRQFFKVAEMNKLIFVETLFWKSKRDAYEIENGYGSYTETSKASAQVWSEHEEDELRRLFMEHQNNKVEEDVVDWIVNNLIDNTKSRRMVLKKLKELCLIVDYKKKKLGTRSRAPTNWSADEEAQLKELYEQFKDAQDPLGCILPRLEISRPKNRIVEKMLVMGLIQDKTELRKKRIRNAKSANRRSRHVSNDSGESSIDDSDSDNGSPQPGTSSAPSTTAPRKIKNINRATAVHKNRKKAHVQVGRSQQVKLLLDNVEAGRQEALQWFKESLSDAVEDMEDGNNEGIPLVPIMDYAQAAMDSPHFLALLKAFGICEPFDEQEIYWRIPGFLTVPTLEDYCSLIQEALDGTLTLTEPEPTAGQIEEESDDEDVFERLREINRESRAAAQASLQETETDPTHNLKQSRTTGNNSSKQRSDAENEAEESGSSQIRKRIRTVVESDEESEDEVSENRKEVEEVSNVKNRSRIIQSDSDDEDAEKENVDRTNSLEDREIDGKRQREASGSDCEKPTAKKGRIIDSDDE